MVEPGETKVKTEGIEEKRLSSSKRKIKETTIRPRMLIKLCQSY